MPLLSGSPAPDPLVSRWHAAAALRQARQEAGLSRGDVVSAQEWGLSKVVRIETAESGLSKPDLLALLDLYGISDPQERDRLAALARAGRARPWHSSHRVPLGPLSRLQLSLETGATRILEHHGDVIPPPLQTDDYARALLETFRVPDVSGHLGLLAERRRRLAAAAAGAIRYTVSEGALHRAVGGPDVMRAQLLSLRANADRLGAEVFVVPYTAGALPVIMPVAFTVVELGEADSAAFLGGLEPEHVTVNPREVDACRSRFEALAGMSLDAPAAARLIDALTAGTRAGSAELSP